MVVRLCDNALVGTLISGGRLQPHPRHELGIVWFDRRGDLLDVVHSLWLGGNVPTTSFAAYSHIVREHRRVPIFLTKFEPLLL